MSKSLQLLLLVIVFAAFSNAQNCRVFGIGHPTTPPVLREIDPLSGAFLSSVPVTEAGYVLTGAHGLTAHPITHEFFALLRRSTAQRVLARVDRATGVASTIGVLPDLFSSITFNVSRQPGVFLCVQNTFLCEKSKFTNIATQNAGTVLYGVTGTHHHTICKRENRKTPKNQKSKFFKK